MNDLLLHNCMLDSGSSVNTMTRKIMEQLNLKITRPYHNVGAMDSREVEVDGIIWGFPDILAKYPAIHLNMDILIIDVPEKWGMLLSRKWVADLGGSIQMDWNYSTAPLSKDTILKFHSEKEKKHHVENPKKPSNEYVYHTISLGNYSCYSIFFPQLIKILKMKR